MKSENVVVGTFERVAFPEMGIADVIAKIDTGAYTGALHCTFAEERETSDGKVLYFIPFGDKEKAQTISNYYAKHVKSSNGAREKRFIVTTEIIIRGQKYSIILSLANREGMKYPVLIGRRFLRLNKLVVDATQYKK